MEKTLELVTDDIYSLGTGAEEVAVNKAEFERLLRMEIAVIPSPIEYAIREMTRKYII